MNKLFAILLASILIVAALLVYTGGGTIGEIQVEIP